MWGFSAGLFLGILRYSSDALEALFLGLFLVFCSFGACRGRYLLVLVVCAVMFFFGPSSGPIQRALVPVSIFLSYLFLFSSVSSPSFLVLRLVYLHHFFVFVLGYFRMFVRGCLLILFLCHVSLSLLPLALYFHLFISREGFLFLQFPFLMRGLGDHPCCVESPYLRPLISPFLCFLLPLLGALCLPFRRHFRP